MGQQIPFQTLDDVADGLCRTAAAMGRPPRAETVAVGGERLQRLDLSLVLDSGVEQDVHVYEAYWAPLTEGRVTLRDVIAFFVTGAIGGIRTGDKPFRRWLFNQYVRFPAPLRAVSYLELALAVLASLAVLDAAILAVAAARLPLRDHPLWATDALVYDLTTVLNMLITAFVPLGVTLAWAALARRAKRPAGVGVVSVAAFILALWATMAAAVLVVAVVAYHSAHDQRLADVIGWGSAAARFDAGFAAVASVALVIAAIAAAIRRVTNAQREMAAALPQNQDTEALTRWVRAGFLAMAATLGIFAEEVLRRGGIAGAAGGWWRNVSWPLVLAVTLVVRNFLIEYTGDVAAYVQPQRLDRFYELRHRIKDAVLAPVRAVYAGGYEHIVLVGHSLGSVVMYDALDRLILDEQMTGSPANVVERTRLFLTFGSPLDKTAFIFGAQGKGSEPREALAASVQPLLTDNRPRWINIWSPWDVIGGALDYYDLPDRSNPHPVENRRDPHATTLLVAHVEYWNNPLIYRTILDALAQPAHTP
jgi:hypothetical protein